MIPITIGILQSQGTQSFAYNLINCIGIYLRYCNHLCTFWFTCWLRRAPLRSTAHASLIYYRPNYCTRLFSPFNAGIYDEIYVPKAFNNSQRKHNGSVISSFLMGMASGTIASPCVSPGLAMLLSIVVTLGSKLIGSSFIYFWYWPQYSAAYIGTFSSSLSMMPRAGMWMVEIKKLFGFMIFGMCFYYANYIIPSNILSWFIALFVLATGIYYLHSSQYMHHSSTWKKINLWMGILAIAGSIVLLTHAFRTAFATRLNLDTITNDPWHTDYQTARQQARTENKKLFIDFWALFCPVCLAINKKVLTKQTVLTVLSNHVLLKVDGTHKTNEPYASIKDTFNVIGFPTFLLIDPDTQHIIKQWGGELYEMSDEVLLKELA